ncbi:IstB domain protein ATP-binding protein [Salinisphaera hydrothermalis C27AD]
MDAGYKVHFRNALDLVEELELVEMNGALKKKIQQLAKVGALVIDELGCRPMSPQARYALFQLVNRFYEDRPLIMTTNKDFTHCGEFFHDAIATSCPRS